jgi:diguanylate cyclase (GGDEF)-like protein/PAS domain S-box-containing protein
MPPAAPRPGGRGHAQPDDEQGATAPPYDPLLAYETILERSRLNVTIYDCDLVVRDVSRSAAELAHMTRDAMVGCSLRDCLPSDDVASTERVIAGETIEIEDRIASELCPEGHWTHVLMVPIRDGEGLVHGGMTIVVDVSEQKLAEELAEKLAFIDPVTDLPNRAMLSMMLSRALSGAKAAKRQLALVWVNLDRFKDVNDALGREAGDRLLKAVGERLHERVRTNDMVARVGDDDFALLLPRINSRRHLKRLMGRVHDVFATPFIVGSESVLLSASCGIAVHPNGGSDANELQEHAHTAMRAAKGLGGGACEIYEADLVEDAGHRLRLVGEIRDGIEQGHFILHYQPEIHLQSMNVQALEALVRWEHPERGLLAPGEFIGFAEETAVIVPLGRHILERACDHHKGWHESLGTPPRLAINVSAREFQRTDVCGQVREVAEAAGLSPSALEIEITETAVLADPAHAAEVADCLREAGATIALDDFGTGYSSLTHLRDLPIDRVKIDSSFVTCCLEDRSAAAILVGITHIAHDLGMEVVAEGVETQAQLDFVRAVGCDAAQGYHLARPMSHADCTEYLLRAAEGPAQ